jgi:hypothetical protein
MQVQKNCRNCFGRNGGSWNRHQQCVDEAEDLVVARNFRLHQVVPAKLGKVAGLDEPVGSFLKRILGLQEKLVPTNMTEPWQILNA